MAVYYVVLIYLLFCVAVFSVKSMPPRIKSVLFFSAGFVLLMVAGLRYRVGTDYAAYQYNYTVYLNGEVSLLSQPVLALVARLSSLIYNDYATWFFLMAALTMIPIFVTIRNKSLNIGFSLILFVLMGPWHTSFNIVKQSAAMAVLFAGYSFLTERRFWAWLILCLVAAMVHVSALFMIPIYFLARPEFSWKHVILCLALGFVVMLIYEPLFLVMDALKSETGGTISSGSDVVTTEVNFLRVMVSLAPFAFFLLKKYDFTDKEFCVLFNMSLVNAVLSVASSQSIYINRIVIYTNIFNIMFYPYLLRPFGKNARLMVYALIFALYLVFWSYDLYKCSDTVQFYWIFDR